MSDGQFVQEADPDEVFAALADGTRIAILRALWDADGEPLSFSRLREAVGMRDSGQFNYHLDKLVGRFVVKGEAGYELTEAGMRINGAIEAGAYTVEGRIEPVDLEDPCPTCGGGLRFHYEEETVRFECDSCRIGYQFGAPPAVFAGYERAAFPSVAARYLRRTVRHLELGFCVFCEGRVRPRVGPLWEIDPPSESSEEVPDDVVERLGDAPMVEYACQQCGRTPMMGLPQVLLEHPAVTGFYHDRGVDVSDRSDWVITDLDPTNAVVRDRDPFRASVTYEADGDELTLVVDEALEVVAIED